MNRGVPQANDSCVTGFDKFTFVQGSTANAFNFWFIDAWYNIPLFAKRSLQAFGFNRRQSSSGGIVIPADQADSPLVQLVNGTASNFEQTFNDSLWATYPNPFQGYSAAMTDVTDLLLVSFFSMLSEARTS
jgi:lysophospholipase